MPHDVNGRKVEVNDFVKVKTYNRDHYVLGRVVRVCEASETCNAVVSWTKNVDVLQSGDNYGDIYLDKMSTDYDYTECKAMEVILRGDGSVPT